MRLNFSSHLSGLLFVELLSTMTTATAEEEISVDPSNEEPASKKIRLDDEPSSSSDAVNTSKDDPPDQTTDTSSPTKV